VLDVTLMAFLNFLLLIAHRAWRQKRSLREQHSLRVKESDD
jgi:hypothetical protein